VRVYNIEKKLTGYPKFLSGQMTQILIDLKRFTKIECFQCVQPYVGSQKIKHLFILPFPIKTPTFTHSKTKNLTSMANTKSKKRIIKIIIGIAVLSLIVLGLQYLELRQKVDITESTQNETKIVNLIDGSTAVLAPHTDIEYHYYFQDQGRFVNLLNGKVNFTVVEEKGTFRVKTPREFITVGETDFEVETNKSSTKVTVQKGKLNIRQYQATDAKNLKNMDIEAGETVISTLDTLYKIL
jgi:ferric-dicitrate binding protein FerR (iron transport regulator)